MLDATSIQFRLKAHVILKRSNEQVLFRYSSAQHDLAYSCGLSGRTKVMDFNETALQMMNFNLGGLVM